MKISNKKTSFKYIHLQQETQHEKKVITIIHINIHNQQNSNYY